MKISVSLTEDDLSYLDEQTESGVFASRSAAIHAGIRALRDADSADAYVDAWDEWVAGDGGAWDSTLSDGVA